MDHIKAIENLSVDEIQNIGFQFLRFALPIDDYGDWLYAYILFARVHQRKPTNEMLFNDYIFRIKTSSDIKNPLRSYVTDKEYLKKYVTAVVGDQYNVPTLNVVRTQSLVDTIDFPNNCCIKPTHLSGAVLFRKLGEEINRQILKNWLQTNYYIIWREFQYKFLIPKIIIEPLIFDQFGATDYKFHCYKGQVKFIQVDLDRQTNHTRILFDSSWNEINIMMSCPISDRKIEKPKNFEEMILVAKSLSKEFEYVRVDLYSDDDKCFVGEITNTPANASEKFQNIEDEKRLSKLLFE
jgi:hypothetical protein